MTEFETVLVALLVPAYGILFYIAGRMNLFELLLKMAEEKMKECIDKRGKHE